jgi:putative membrane protein
MMKRKRFIIIPSAIPALLLAGCLHRPVGGSMRSWDHMMGYGGYGGMLMWLILLIIAGVVVYFLVTRGRGTSLGRSTESQTPLDILRRRYASGEISKEEFDRLKRDIEA